MAGGSDTHGIVVALLAVIDRAAAIKQLMILWWCTWNPYSIVLNCSMVMLCMMASVDLGKKKMIDRCREQETTNM